MYPGLQSGRNPGALPDEEVQRLTCSGVLAVIRVTAYAWCAPDWQRRCCLRRGSSVWLLLVACFLKPSNKKVA